MNHVEHHTHIRTTLRLGTVRESQARSLHAATIRLKSVNAIPRAGGRKVEEGRRASEPVKNLELLPTGEGLPYDDGGDLPAEQASGSDGSGIDERHGSAPFGEYTENKIGDQGQRSPRTKSFKEKALCFCTEWVIAYNECRL